MTKYVLLYTGGGMPETEEEQAAVLGAWTAWYTDLGGAVVDPGYPFMPMVKHIDSSGHVSDGAAGPPNTGYTIVEADSLDAAASMGQKCPVLGSGGQVTVYETLELNM